MPAIASFEIWCVDLPFRQAFKHAASERQSSESLFLRCTLDNGAIGYGECLPRRYVSGETRDGAFRLLASKILPPLVGRGFDDLPQVIQFLRECDGKAPADIVEADVPQTAAWCAVDLAILDAFGHAFNLPIDLAPGSSFPKSIRYSPVVSSSAGTRLLLLIRLLGFPQVKLKVESKGVTECVSRARRWLGSRCDIRVDANMAWDTPQALAHIKSLAPLGVRSFEQPLAAENLEGMAQLVRETTARIMVDEGLTDRASLERLATSRACNAVNLRISKCGGLIGTLSRARQARDAGLEIQVGCQVGESSLLSAAQLKLLLALPDALYVEGCFGRRLLYLDPALPLLQFRAGGRPPSLPRGPGLGIRVDAECLHRWSTQFRKIERTSCRCS